MSMGDTGQLSLWDDDIYDYDTEEDVDSYNALLVEELLSAYSEHKEPESAESVQTDCCHDKMTILRGFRYRVYPDEEQEKIFYEWERTSRYVWNKALRSRLDRLNKKKCVEIDGKFFTMNETYFDGEWRAVQVISRMPWLSYLDQQAALTPMRKEVSWVGDGLCCTEQGVLRDLDKAWQMWAKNPYHKTKNPKGVGLPRFKKFKDSVGMVINKEFESLKNIKDGYVFLSKKVGWVKARVHRELLGKSKRISLVRDGSAWYVSILSEVTIDDPGPSSNPVVAIDRGVVVTIADSDGKFWILPKRIKHLSRRLDRMKSRNDKRVVDHSKGAKRTKNWENGSRKICDLSARIARIRRQWLHEVALYYSVNYSVVVVEDLKIKNMTKSSKGDEESPGKMVAQKAGLNRSILEQGWGMFVDMLKYKMEARGGVVVSVPPYNTSNTCSNCGNVDKDSRRSQSEFVCTRCGYEDNADHNASLVILDRHINGLSKLEGGYRVEKKPKNKLRVLKRKKKTGLPAGKSESSALPGGIALEQEPA